MNLTEFAGLSVILTGYTMDIILPSDDTQHMAQDYLDTLQTPGLITGNGLQQLTDAWNAISSSSQVPVIQQVRTNIMDNATLAPIAKNIIYMWYLGIWYDLTVAPGTYPNKDFVISSKAYKNGLIWGDMGAHPMGYSEGAFGYWGKQPVIPSAVS